MSDYISEMTGDELQRNLRDAYGMISALNDEVQDLFRRNQKLQSENDKLQQRKQDAVDEAYKLRQAMRKKDKYAIDAKIELDESLRVERTHVAKLQSENAKLRAQLADLRRIIKYIDKKFPRADETCDEPGITLSEAVRRTLAEQ